MCPIYFLLSVGLALLPLICEENKAESMLKIRDTASNLKDKFWIYMFTSTLPLEGEQSNGRDAT